MIWIAVIWSRKPKTTGVLNVLITAKPARWSFIPVSGQVDLWLAVGWQALTRNGLLLPELLHERLRIIWQINKVNTILPFLSGIVNRCYIVIFFAWLRRVFFSSWQYSWHSEYNWTAVRREQQFVTDTIMMIWKLHRGISDILSFLTFLTFLLLITKLNVILDRTRMSLVFQLQAVQNLTWQSLHQISTSNKNSLMTLYFKLHFTCDLCGIKN